MKVITTNPGRIQEENLPREIVKEKAIGPLAILKTQRDQTILGFGAALTESSCILLNKLPKEELDSLLDEVYSPSKSNFSLGRICVGASDYADTNYNYAKVANDMEIEHFDASHDDQEILPILRRIRDINPELYLFSSPWSPPGWMKSSGMMEGGWMLDKYVTAYAKYYLKFLQHYRNAGVNVDALTPQNESETDQTSKMPACLWHPDIESRFAKELREMLDSNGFESTKIWLMDHNFIMWHRASYQMEDPDTKAACAGIAWHPYQGYPEMIGWFRQSHPECENHWTEGSAAADLLAPKDRLQYTVADLSKCFIRALENGCQSITIWNLTLDEIGYPNIGPFACRGAIEIGHDGKHIKRNKDYYALTHFSKYIKRGAKRIVIDKVSIPSNIEVVAFENPDGDIVVLASNTDSFDTHLNLCINDRYVSVHLPRESVNTVLL